MKAVIIGGVVAVLIIGAFLIGSGVEDEPDTVGEAVGETIDEATGAE